MPAVSPHTVRCGARLRTRVAPSAGSGAQRPSAPPQQQKRSGKAQPPPPRPPRPDAGGERSKSGFAPRQKRAPLAPPSQPRGSPAAPPPPPPPVVSHPDAAALATLPALAEGPALSAATLLSFERDGHVPLRSLLTTAEVEQLAPGLRAAGDAARLAALRTGVRCALGEAALRDDLGFAYESAEELEEVLSTAGARVPFLQVFNLWRDDCAAARRLACSPRLVHAAAALLGCAPSAVRLYQDALFHKRAGDAATRWHADLAMAPLDCNAFVTLWLPLQAVPARDAGGTALDYAPASHRDVALHYWQLPTDDLGERFPVIADHGALALGDASAHHGWCLHAAPPARRGTGDRLAWTASYFVDGARLLADPLGAAGPGGRPGYDEDAESYAGWVAALGGAAVAAHEAVPLALSVTPR